MTDMQKTIDLLEQAQSDIAGALAELRNRAGIGSWMGIAHDEIGVHELPGLEHHPRILEYLRTTTLGRWASSRDETPWCSAFVNWCMARAGIEGTGSAMARSWLGWGVELDEPREGCVVILKRGAAPAGHVGFYTGHTGDGTETFQLLGGNQANSVCTREYSYADVLGYRWPA